jgi:uncharacterized cupin superfamily protein
LERREAKVKLRQQHQKILREEKAHTKYKNVYKRTTKKMNGMWKNENGKFARNH